jgi:undecaprenyl-diphosphatase
VNPSVADYPTNDYAASECIATDYVPAEFGASLSTTLSRIGEGLHSAGLVDSSASADSPEAAWPFEGLDRWELPIVRFVASSSNHPLPQMLTRSLNWLGNGWLYPICVVLALLCLELTQALRVIAACGISAGLCFTLYPWLKKRLRRHRPFQLDARVVVAAPPLDYFSCPSGHTMAATAVAIPLYLGVPLAMPAIVSVWTLICWSRVSAGHHFPTDLLLGALIGAAVSVPVAMLTLAL